MKWYLAVLKKYADFNGRARRSEYWYFALFNFLISMTLMVIGYSLRIPVLNSIYSLGVLLPSLAVAIRRMHDVNKSGWYILIPIYNLILAFTEGTKGPNDYGPDPKNEFFDEIDQWGNEGQQSQA
jgi:uncharacterized membrane protein YhaH (DUF805 family)